MSTVVDAERHIGGKRFGGSGLKIGAPDDCGFNIGSSSVLVGPEIGCPGVGTGMGTTNIVRAGVGGELGCEDSSSTVKPEFEGVSENTPGSSGPEYRMVGPIIT
jgi:hypothetical protein